MTTPKDKKMKKETKQDLKDSVDKLKSLRKKYGLSNKSGDETLIKAAFRKIHSGVTFSQKEKNRRRDEFSFVVKALLGKAFHHGRLAEQRGVTLTDKIRVDAMDLCFCDRQGLQKLLDENEGLNVCIPIVSVDGAEWELAEDWDGNKKRCDHCNLEDT